MRVTAKYEDSVMSFPKDPLFPNIIFFREREHTRTSDGELSYHKEIREIQTWVGEKALWVKALATELDKLSSILRTQG